MKWSGSRPGSEIVPAEASLNLRIVWCAAEMIALAVSSVSLSAYTTGTCAVEEVGCDLGADVSGGK